MHTTRKENIHHYHRTHTLHVCVTHILKREKKNSQIIYFRDILDILTQISIQNEKLNIETTTIHYTKCHLHFLQIKTASNIFYGWM